MPTKFVAHAAERAGVSLETAEHHWAEAKKAITKGKRKGHWYWGKVMNTFKRMMGLMEVVTLKEWMMLEEDSTWAFSKWPEHIRLYGPYVAVRNEEYPHYVKYEVEELMGEPVNVQLSAGIIRGHNDAYEGGASYTAGKNGHFTQGLGIKVPAGEAFDINEFKKWAIDAMKTGAQKLGLTEELEDDSSEADFQFKMILKAFQSSGFILDSSADDLSAGFVKGKWIYEFYCQSEADDTWFLGIGPEDGAGTYKKMWNGLSSTKVITTAKDWAAKHPPKVAEAVDNFPIRQRIRYWDKEVYLKGGYTMSMNDHQPGKTMFGITRLMENSVCGIANIFQRRQAGFVYWWSMHDRTGKQIAVQGVSDGEAFDQALFKKWVTEQLAKLPDDTAK
jgi:hypothetical protein